MSFSHHLSSRKRNDYANGIELPREHRHNDTTQDAAAPSTTEDEPPPQYPGSDSACVRADASTQLEDRQPRPDLGVWDSADLDGTFDGTLDGTLDDTTALSWPPTLDDDWPGFSGSPSVLPVGTLNPGIHNPPRPLLAASSGALCSDNNNHNNKNNDDDFNSKPSRLLHIAARNGTTGILLSLIKAGADVNSRDCSGTTRLHIAVRFRRASVLEVLVNHGANINARDSANMTALKVAVRAQDEELVNVLLSGGAELH
ncbi:hypothetical protein NW762_002377 [Fusarium torreyae]|uniref:Ankyrin repeat protein n=1 Tax=Fusarium torreyae TaxID=1237075 RepID=A0A9W8SAG7_9HYPO|nr:hypothetical protein NW762_002377 [Fusarium torreyae]